MNQSIVTSFSIRGLFGTDDVHIPFPDRAKILIGENGLGKTQVLNLFYFTLTKNFPRLNDYNFHSLALSFSNGSTVELTKEQIEQFLKRIYPHPYAKELLDEMGLAQFEALRDIYLKSGKDFRRFEKYSMPAFRVTRHFSIFDVFRVFQKLGLEDLNPSDPHFDQCQQDISEALQGMEILYFPTYRRVEEDLYNLGADELGLALEPANKLIQFGMGDVKKRFANIENTIDKLLKEGLAQFTKDILNVVIDEETPSEGILDKIDQNDIEIILSRVGGLLPEKQKQAVRNILANKQLKNPLSAYLLQKLIEIYEKQKKLDQSVKVFRDACNRYLINKEVFYDESAINIYIRSTRTGEDIDLRHLSSGEKQIVSMLSTVYLSEAGQRFLVLFDEPELSLSMTWQKQLLPDILNSNKCDFLLAVTHSPFIFDNELDSYAVGMSEYVKPSLVAVEQ